MNKFIYDVNKFKILKIINNDLKSNIKSIQIECNNLILNMKQINKKRNADGEWDKVKSNNFVSKLKQNNEWILSWTEDHNWKNYLLIHEGEMLNDIKKNLPTLYNLLNKYKDKFNLVGLSLLEGNSTIPYHNDGNTTLKLNRLVYHFNILIPSDYNNLGDSIITIYDNNGIGKNIKQKTGESLVFDSGYYHCVINSNPNYRLILYTDFKVDQMI